MRSLNAEEVAQKVYNALFFSMADVNIEQLMGTWYTVSTWKTSAETFYNRYRMIS